MEEKAKRDDGEMEPHTIFRLPMFFSILSPFLSLSFFLFSIVINFR